MSTKDRLQPDDPRHGTQNGYRNLGCRCAPCREANTIACRETRNRPKQPKVDIVPIPGEEWRPAYGYEGIYEVSNKGRIRGLDRMGRHWRGNLTVPVWGKLLSASTDVGGYQVVGLSRDGVVRRMQVHVAVLEAFVSPRPEGMQCCHNNGIPDDNRLENLRWGTPSENTLDTVRHGTHPQARKTHCPQGHEYTPENTLPHETNNGRRCKACQGDGFGRGTGYHNASKTHCKRGHEFTEENTQQRATGRECRQCARMHSRNWRAAQKEMSA